MPYYWRKLTPSQQAEVLKYCQWLKRPWHRPPHFDQGAIFYHLTGACLNHEPYIGHSPERMADFSRNLLECFDLAPAAWCVLPNHYHVLVRCQNVKATVKSLGQLHGKHSYLWNKEEDSVGRQVWHGVSDRGMRGPDHFWATVNYIHHNPVKHGYVQKWTEWPFSSVDDYLEEVGRESAEQIWKTHPILDYGKGWDDGDM
jgi:putative transposase